MIIKDTMMLLSLYAIILPAILVHTCGWQIHVYLKKFVVI